MCRVQLQGDFKNFFVKFWDLFSKFLKIVISEIPKIISVSLEKKYRTLGKIFREISKNISEIKKKKFLIFKKISENLEDYCWEFL